MVFILFFLTFIIYKGGQHHQQKPIQQQVQYHQEVTPSKQSMKRRLISDDYSETSNAMDDAQSIEGKKCCKLIVTFFISFGIIRLYIKLFKYY